MEMRRRCPITSWVGQGLCPHCVAVMRPIYNGLDPTPSPTVREAWGPYGGRTVGLMLPGLSRRLWYVDPTASPPLSPVRLACTYADDIHSLNPSFSWQELPVHGDEASLSNNIVGWSRVLLPLCRHHAPNLEPSRSSTVGCCT